MYGLPSNFNAERLVGCLLEQVSFSVNTVHLSFKGNVSITVESCFKHYVKEDAGEPEPTRLPIRESNLMQLLGELIQSAQADPDGTLSLTFSNGHRLLIFDDTPYYEAYRINIGDTEIIV